MNANYFVACGLAAIVTFTVGLVIFNQAREISLLYEVIDDVFSPIVQVFKVGNETYYFLLVGNEIIYTSKNATQSIQRGIDYAPEQYWDIPVCNFTIKFYSDENETLPHKGWTP